MIEIIKGDFREYNLPKNRNILTITDPPYNINFKYKHYKDNLKEEEYISLLSKIPKPCVIIHYPEETLNYVIPAMGSKPDKILFWCYNSNLGRCVRWVSFFGIKPDLNKYKIPYRNKNDKRIKERMMNGSIGRPLTEWFIMQQVKNVSKEYQGYVNQIPEELIRIILKVCEGNFNFVFEPFLGSGTTLKVAKEMGYDGVGFDICEEAIKISKKRIEQEVLFYATKPKM